MAKVWRFLPFDAALVGTLSRELQVSPILAQVLAARGYTSGTAALAFLGGKLSELHEPELLPGVSAAADRIAEAVRGGRRVTVYGDYDVDGVTATSLLWHCLKLAGGVVDYYIPNRLEEGYGLNCEALRKLHEEDPARLVVSVDCGIASTVEAAHARELGLELIITDHHEFAASLPDALLVHPRLPGGSYPFGELCGVGVAFKLAWGICQRLGDGKKSSPRMRDFLVSAVGLTAIGTVADVVPLVGENRILVRHGLASLREKSSVGLKALLRHAGLADRAELHAEDVAFAIAPRLNAVGRMGQARLAVELLTTENFDRAEQLAEYIDAQNKVRQSVERKMLKQAKELAQAHPEWLDQPALVLAHREWHAGVIGIVASRVAEHFQKPTVMISLERDDGLGQGSCRTFGQFDLHGGLTACAEHLRSYGGHRAAAGLKIETGRVDAFRAALCQHVGETYVPTEADTELRIDAEIRLNDLTLRAVQELDRLGPFGQANRRPVFAATRVELAEPPRTMGEGDRHLTVKVKQGGRPIRGVAFGRAEWAEEMAAVQGPLLISFAPQINRYQGRENVEIQLLDWKPARAADRPADPAGLSAGRVVP